jgi:putative tryptophan/tyrosine transport system substrate-binding protein
MRRREFMTVIGGMTVAWPLVALAQQPVRIGLLNSGADSFFVAPFVGKLGELGYLEGKNIVIERKFAAGNSERLKEFAADLVQQHVDVIVTIGTLAGFAAKQATRSNRIWRDQRPRRCRSCRKSFAAWRKCHRQFADVA